MCVDLSLGFLSCSIDLYFCFCASTILFLWLYLCSRVWSQGVWFLQLLVVEWIWVLTLRWRSLGELSLIDITWGWQVSGGPMSWTRLSHLRGSGLTPGRSTKTLSATRHLWTPEILVVPNQLGFVWRIASKTLRCQGLQQTEGLFTRQPSNRRISDFPPWRQGAQGILGIKNKKAQWSEVQWAWSIRGLEKGAEVVLPLIIKF